MIGEIIDRFRRGAGWNLQTETTTEAKRDRQQLILVFLEQLGAARVPVEEYERCYRRATVTRARLKAEGKSVPFHITPEELVAEWFILEKEIAAKTADDNEKPDLEASVCPDRENHVEGEAVQEYLIWGSFAVMLPCHKCRPKAHSQRQLEAVERRNKSFANRRLEAGEEENERCSASASVSRGAENL